MVTETLLSPWVTVLLGVDLSSPRNEEIITRRCGPINLYITSLPSSNINIKNNNETKPETKTEAGTKIKTKSEDGLHQSRSS